MSPIITALLGVTLPFLPFFFTTTSTAPTRSNIPHIAIDKTTNPDLNAKLKLAATNLDKMALLPDDESWTFRFDEQEKYTFAPGSVVNANAATFPALTGMGMTVAMLNLGPCAMLPPHMHPRATNLVVGISGNTTSWMYNENGARTVEVNLLPLVMTVFPRGSLHTMQNNGCENAQLVSVLDSEDTGTLNFLNGLYNLPPEMVFAGFGNNPAVDVPNIGKKIPDVGTGSVRGSAECMKRCGMTMG